jgi:hypothetical protein
MKIRWWPVTLTMLLAAPALQAQVGSISGNGYTQTTPFLPAGKSAEETHALALGYRMDGGKRTNVILYEHVALKYSADMSDSAATYLYAMLTEEKTDGKTKWMNRGHFTFQRSAVQPNCKSKGYIQAFDLDESQVADIRGKNIFNLDAYVETKDHRSIYAIYSSSPAGAIFKTNAAKIPGGKTAYDPATPFLANRIPLQSLLNKTRETIEARLNTPIKDTVRNGITFLRYASPHGVYEVNYENGLANEVRMYPRYKFHLDNTHLRTTALPFDIQPVNGPGYTGDYSAVTSTDEWDQGIIYTYKGGKKTRVMVRMKDRFIEVATVDNY